MKAILDRCLKLGAESAQCFTLRQRSEGFEYTAGKLETIGSEDVTGHHLTVNAGGRQASVVFTGGDPAVADRALEMAALAGRAEYDFPKSLEPAPMDQTEPGLFERPKEELTALADGLMKRLEAIDPAISVQGGVGRTHSERWIRNTFGVEAHSIKDTGSFGAAITTAREGDIYVASANRPSVGFDEEAVDSIVAELEERYHQAKDVVDLSPGVMPALFTPDAVAQLSLAMDGLKGHALFTGTSPFEKRLGEAIVSEKVTLVDDGLRPDGWLAHPFDDEGVAGQRTPIIEAGVLEGFLVNLRSAARLGRPPTGNGLRNKIIFNAKDFSLGASEGFTNLVLEPGDVPFADMLAEVKEGILIDSLFGLVMGNTVVGEVNTSLDTAFALRNGKIVGRVKGRAIGINLYDLLRDHLVAVEDRVTFRTGIGAGSFYMPHLLFKDVPIS